MCGLVVYGVENGMTMSLYFAFETVRVRERVINVLLPKINFAMPQYYTQVSKMSAARRPENKTLPSCRVRYVFKCEIIPRSALAYQECTVVLVMEVTLLLRSRRISSKVLCVLWPN